MRNRILLIDDDSGGLLNESTLARAARVVARHAMVLPFDLAAHDQYCGVLRSRAETPYAIARSRTSPKRKMAEGVARVDPAELSRFEGEGGAQAPEFRSSNSQTRALESGICRSRN